MRISKTVKMLAIKTIAVTSILITASVNAETIRYTPNKVMELSVSKGGLNRITYSPYKIIQVTGDEGKYRIKYDEDGSSIYLIPLVNVGEVIEVSLRNNAGQVQDLHLKVASKKGSSLVIDGAYVPASQKANKDIAANMLRAMKDNQQGIFYVQKHKQGLGNINGLNITQIRTYQYKNIKGGVFAISNITRDKQIFSKDEFNKRFSNVIASYPENITVKPKRTALFYLVQKVEE
jgi:hypothetical protein